MGLRAIPVALRRGVPRGGANVRQLHIQNEPDSDQKFPSCRWSGEKLRDFLRDDLGPAFAEAADDCELWLGTIERGDFDAWIHPTLADPAARRFLAGVGFQWAGKAAVQATRLAAPDLELMQTENECGDGANTWDHALYVFSLLHHYLVNGVSSYLYWNMVLPPGGRSTWGWAQNAMVTVDPETQAVTWNPDYHVMRHAAGFVAPGAERLPVTGHWAGSALAFRNPDGSRVLFAANRMHEPAALEADLEGERFRAELPPRSLHTFRVGG